MSDTTQMTDRQRKWFAAVREGLLRQTGRTVEQWAELARACPETAHRKRLAWLKAEHGLGQNHASLVLDAAFPSPTGWSEPDALAGALWSDPQAQAIFEAVKALASALPDVVVGQRKGFTAFSRKVQFAAARPKKGLVLLGLAVDPAADPDLAPARNEGWSERLHGVLTLASIGEVDARVERLLKAAWERA